MAQKQHRFFICGEKVQHCKENYLIISDAKELKEDHQWSVMSSSSVTVIDQQKSVRNVNQ